MKFGVREICDVVLKAKANQKIGNKIFYKNRRTMEIIAYVRMTEEAMGK